ncbi:hypothetical protein ASD69_18540 [Lysobacter sp. Root604]|nr:hypothetical protein ASD69_18540 [Lysobacter sp. Root604]
MLQPAGEAPLTSILLLPAAATTMEPLATAVLTAACQVGVSEQGKSPPSERLITSAGLALAGAPATLPPEAQTMPSAMSASEPLPSLPSTRTGTTLAP